jgi:phosphoglycerate-specific signal transduction histidine kinase
MAQSIDERVAALEAAYREVAVGLRAETQVVHQDLRELRGEIVPRASALEAQVAVVHQDLRELRGEIRQLVTALGQLDSRVARLEGQFRLVFWLLSIAVAAPFIARYLP